MVVRIGFACIHLDATTGKTPKHLGFRTATVKFVTPKKPKERVAYLEPVILHNLRALYEVLHVIAARPPEQRMFRITSGLLPLFTHPVAQKTYSTPSIVREIENALARIGTFARQESIRLSQHPGQYVVLNSLNDKTVASSIAELEYHTHIARLMGYTQGWHRDGYTMNIHGGARAGGVSRFISNAGLLSKEARNILTVENDESSFGIFDLEPIMAHYPLVIDPHHHWVRCGKYMKHRSKYLTRVIQSWRGVRPKMHVSMSPLPLVIDAGGSSANKPDRAFLLEAGVKKMKLREHSNMIWNPKTADYFLGFLDRFDLMVEAKGKDLASADLYHRAVKTGII